MDSKKLKEKLQPLVDFCISNEINVCDVTVKETLPGAIPEKFYVDLCIPNLTLENYEEIHSKAFNYFWNDLDKDIKFFISGFCINNKCEEIQKNDFCYEKEVEIYS